MGDNPSNEKTANNGFRLKKSAHQLNQPTVGSPRHSTSSTSSQDNQDPYIGFHVHQPAPDDMDNVGDSRKRRAMLMNHPDESIANTLRDANDPRRQRQKGRDELDDTSTQKHTPSFPVNGHSSEFSSVSASDDAERDHLSSDLGFTDDEETGLAKKELGESKRKRRKHTRLDKRVARSASIPKQERSSADKSVIKALITNALLIASWYAFSLSISIVGFHWLFNNYIEQLTSPSTTNGCSHQNISTSNSHSSRHACTCLYNLL